MILYFFKEITFLITSFRIEYRQNRYHTGTSYPLNRLPHFRKEDRIQDFGNNCLLRYEGTRIGRVRRKYLHSNKSIGM